VLADKTNVQDTLNTSEKHPSIGSAQHATGDCKRCCFFPRNRCSNGYDCEFCHYEHEKRSHRKRKTKKNSLGIDVDFDDLSEDASKYGGLEIQLPLSPDSFPGDVAIGSWSFPQTPHSFPQTPEAASVFVHSCLYTMPADTKENTTAVPVYTPTLWGDEQKVASVRSWNSRDGEYTSTDGKRYQIPRDWSRHPNAISSCENRYTPDSGAIILPETAPLSVHQWQDMGTDQWQNQRGSWPVEQADWDYSSKTAQQAWDWNVHSDAGYYGAWNAGTLSVDQSAPIVQASTGWNPSQSDSHMPEYMPALPSILSGVAAANDAKNSIITPATDSTARQALPTGVDASTDAEPPLLVSSSS
jgi:hypothetical protein